MSASGLLINPAHKKRGICFGLAYATGTSAKALSWTISIKGFCKMQGDAPVSWLMFFTFAATIVIIAGASIRHLHSQRNRDIAATALAGDNAPRIGITPNGALADLAGVLVFALIIMGLLGWGYHQKSSLETAQAVPPVASGSMAQPAGVADRPKDYQPANPVPDTRSAPTSSSTGVGPDNGGRPENQPKQ